MLTTMLTLAAFAQAAPAAVPAPAPAAAAPATRPLSALPNTTIAYFDVPGKNAAAIKKGLNQILADPARKEAVKLFTYDVSAQVLKRTEGTKCTVRSVTAKLAAKVNMPRLAEQAKVPKPDLAHWQTYAASLENDAAANLWFIHDQLRGAERAVAGVDCTGLDAAWNAAMNKIKVDLAAFNASRNPAPAPAAVAAPAPKP